MAAGVPAGMPFFRDALAPATASARSGTLATIVSC
jgi:hypothetical protein